MEKIGRSATAFVTALITCGVCSFAYANTVIPKDVYSSMRWRLVGPFRGGRVLAVSGVNSKPNTYYFGSAIGGVWKTTNDGLTWDPVFNHQAVASIGAVAVDQRHPNTVFVGTGEADPRGDVSFGEGVYKSTDGGKHWNNIGLRSTRHIGKIAIDPHDSNVVYVAALGSVYSPSKARGIYKSTDGGRHWKRVLFVNNRTGAIDVAIDPDNPNIVYAAMWHMYRRPWYLDSGGKGDGLYRSTDAGQHWKRLNGHGLPTGVLGKIGIAFAAKSGGHRIYALIEAKDGGLYRSDNSGKSWRLVSSDQRLRTRAWYFTRIYAGPKSPGTVYVADNGFYKSVDGGKKWKSLPIPGGDNHGFWVNPAHPKHMIESNDQGVVISIDGGKTWSKYYNQPIGQFYHVSTDSQFPYYIYGAQQDEGAIAIASEARGGISRQDWFSVGGADGECGYVFAQPGDPNYVIAGGYGGAVTRYDKKTATLQDIAPWSNANGGHGAAHLKYRFSWTSPLAFSPWKGHALYIGSQYVLETTNHGMSWRKISPDLTRNDKAKQKTSGGPITKDDSSIEYYDVVYSIAPSPTRRGEIWAGTDDGLVWITLDGGKHWKKVTPPSLPKWSEIATIDASPFNPGTAYIAVDDHKLGDFKPYIYRTSDYGKHWEKIIKGLSAPGYVHVVREDPVRKGLLFAGTETGVYVSFDNGNHWQSLQMNLPTTAVRDIAIKGDDLVVATHGRSIWTLNDIEPLRQMTASNLGKAVVFLKPAAAFRLRMGHGFHLTGNLVGANPPQGTIIDYYLKHAESSPVTLKIYDAKGRLVNQFDSAKIKRQPTGLPPFMAQQTAYPFTDHEGLNRFVWNMRYPIVPAIPGAAYDERSPLGVMAPPGTYTASLAVNGVTYKEHFVLKEDPRATATSEDLAHQFDLAMKTQYAMGKDHAVVNQMLDVRAQLKDREKKAEKRGLKNVASRLDALDNKLEMIEAQLYQPNAHTNEELLNYPTELNAKLSYLKNEIDYSDTAPTKQFYEEYRVYNENLDRLVGRWSQIREQELGPLNKTLKNDSLDPIRIHHKENERIPKWLRPFGGRV